MCKNVSVKCFIIGQAWPGLVCWLVLIRDFVTQLLYYWIVHSPHLSPALPSNNIDISLVWQHWLRSSPTLWQDMDRTSPQYYNLSWTSLMLTKLFRNSSLLSNSPDSQDTLVTDMTKSTKKTRIEPQQLRGKISNDSFLTEEDLNIHDSVSIRSLSSVDTQSGRFEPHRSWFQSTSTPDFEQKNYSQVTFQVPDLEENKKLPVIKSDNMVNIVSSKSNRSCSFWYFSISPLLPIPLPQILREREKFLKLKQKPKVKRMI